AATRSLPRLLLPGLVRIRRHSARPLHERDARALLGLRRRLAPSVVRAVSLSAVVHGGRNASARTGAPARAEGLARDHGRRPEARSAPAQTRRPPSPRPPPPLGGRIELGDERVDTIGYVVADVADALDRLVLRIRQAPVGVRLPG